MLDGRNGPGTTTGPAHRRNNDRDHNVPQPPLEGHQPFQSDNPDFPDLIRHSFKYIQTTHHTENWQTIPGKVNQAIDKVVENIRPPAPSDEVTNQLGRAAATFKFAITSAVQKHLQSQAEESKKALKDLDHGDWKEAENLAKKRYQRRFGTRARNDTATDAILALNPIFAKDWTRPKKTGKPTQQGNGGPSITVTNRFQNLDTEGEDGALDELLSAMDAIPPSPNAGSTFRVPTRPRRRRASSPETEAPPKRTVQKHTPETGRPAPSPLPGTSGSAPSTPVPPSVTPVVTPTGPGNRSYADVVVGNPHNRQQWRIGNIPPQIHNVILTDSNGMAWRNTAIPDNTVVYALRGGRLNDGVRILSHDKNQLQSVRTIILALGLNDRDRDTSDIISQIRFLHDWATRSDKNVFFLGVPPFDTLQQSEKENIRFLNDAAADIFGAQFISPITEEEVHITDRDGYGIHYSVTTATSILDQLSPFLN